MRDEEPLFNPTLLEMLKQDYKLEIPMLEGDLPTDHSGLDVPKILAAVRHAVREIKGWEVTEEVMLSTFSFSKYLMWKDLQDNTELLKENPVVRHLIDHPHEAYREQGDFPDVERLDKSFHPSETFCPLSADAYQMAAVYAAAQGRDFVLFGPPGTGKSQTISNMIVQLLAMGKTVLFVSEKMTALEVVHSRLKDVGLADFCLELHSSKANKKGVLAQLSAAWEAANQNISDARWEQDCTRLNELRSTLNEYPARLHAQYENGLSPYKALSVVVADKDKPFAALEWTYGRSLDHSQLDVLRQLMKRLNTAAAQVGAIAENPYTGIAKGDWSPLWQEEFEKTCRKSREAITALTDRCAPVWAMFGITADAQWQQERYEALARLCELLMQLNGRSLDFAFSPKLPAITESILAAAELSALWKKAQQQLSIAYVQDGKKIPVDALLKQWQSAEHALQPLSLELVKVQEVAQRLYGGVSDIAIAVAIESAKNIVNELKRWQQAAATLSLKYVDDGAAIDMDTLCADWQLAQTAWWPKKAMKRSATVKALRLASQEQTPPQPDAVGNDIAQLVIMKEAAQAISAHASAAEIYGDNWQGLATNVAKIEMLINALSTAWDVMIALGNASELVQRPAPASAKQDLQQLGIMQALMPRLEAHSEHGKLLGNLWKSVHSDWGKVNDALAWTKKAAAGVAALAGDDIDFLLALRGQLQRLTTDGIDLLNEGGGSYQKMKAYGEALLTFAQTRTQLATLAELEAQSQPTDWLKATAATTDGWLAHLPQLKDWCAWRTLRGEAINQQLAPVLALLETQAIAPADLADTFERSYRLWWMKHIFTADTVLQKFSGSEHERLIQDFRALDTQYLELTKRYVRTKLTGGTPRRSAQNAQSAGTEWGILNRELDKSARHMPLRQLVSALPNALTRLTPCLLMSPLSIAQYLPAGKRRFDVVIFDEASQIPVWDAVGAIARANQTIIVGDPKQLPPTSFFNRKADADSPDANELEDLESILDECLAARIPPQHLNWHYRSQHESLIIFSNHRYYNGKLVTYPSASQMMALSYHHVPDGIYERGTGQVNRNEAKAVVAETIRLLKDPEFNRKKQSLGIVTFNQKQETLISDLLDREREKDPSLEPHFANERFEPVFVKNLENVQGDQRDIILFSLTYGPDQSGKPVSMNFGPLNKEGGSRRLNVAITRAKIAMKVFGTLKASDINLGRTQSSGVQDFKHFLEFAERGYKALGEAISIPGGDYDSIFEQQVASALRAKGWNIHLQVGVSAYRVDIGVVHPDAPGLYLAGVECDGATYHSSAVARDRDKLRENVLKGLGWNIVRVWSTDWWINAERCTQKLDEALKALLDASRAEVAEEPEYAVEEIEADELAEELPQAFLTEPSVVDHTTYYGMTEIDDLVPQLNAEQFYGISENTILGQLIARIVSHEGPIALEVLAERVARAYEFKRTGPKIAEHVRKVASKMFAHHKENGQEFFWPEGETPKEYNRYRLANPSGDAARKIEHICKQELRALAQHVANTDFPIDTDQHIRAVADKLGIRRVTENIATVISKVLMN